MRKLLFFCLRYSLIPFFLRELIQTRKVSVLVYHDPSKKVIEAHIKWLKKYYNIISLNQFIEYKQENKLHKLPKKSLVITFDDGHKDNYHFLSFLKRHDIPVTIFLCSGIVNTQRHFWFLENFKGKTSNSYKELRNTERLERLKELGFEEKKEYAERQALSKHEILEMSTHVNFQAHTIFHPILPQCNDQTAFQEIANSKIQLEKAFGFDVCAFAYPNGDYTQREIQFLQDSNYICAFTTKGGYNDKQTNIYELKRLGIMDNASISELVVKASGLWSFIKS